ncbi:uncharacterized protein K02A2.6-like [Agrilus planipennis]|uniref:Uncharacterized protein K02A2.6-like n=1 Tax=Agrilus planipennis TaxID=224129 RepID=A0A1W4XGE6_AGRPL|nr:uncharacterized protein K02A2.6-like [Agrilus planipennis]
MIKVKGMARSFVFWPSIDVDITTLVKFCPAPWERIQIDYAGPVVDTMLLIDVDTYNKWLKVKLITSMSTAATITIMDNLFTTYGAARTVVADKSRQFISEEFKIFL